MKRATSTTSRRTDRQTGLSPTRFSETVEDRANSSIDSQRSNRAAIFAAGSEQSSHVKASAAPASSSRQESASVSGAPPRATAITHSCPSRLPSEIATQVSGATRSNKDDARAGGRPGPLGAGLDPGCSERRLERLADRRIAGAQESDPGPDGAPVSSWMELRFPIVTAPRPSDSRGFGETALFFQSIVGGDLGRRIGWSSEIAEGSDDLNEKKTRRGIYRLFRTIDDSESREDLLPRNAARPDSVLNRQRWRAPWRSVRPELRPREASERSSCTICPMDCLAPPAIRDDD